MKKKNLSLLHFSKLLFGYIAVLQSHPIHAIDLSIQSQSQVKIGYPGIMNVSNMTLAGSSSATISLDEHQDITLGCTLIGQKAENEAAILKDGRGTLTIDREQPAFFGSLYAEGPLVLKAPWHGNVDISAVPGEIYSSILFGNGPVLGNLSINDLDTSRTSLAVDLSPTSHSTLTVKQTAYLEGNVIVRQTKGDYPAQGQVTILKAGKILGSFNPKVLQGLPSFTYSLLQVGNRIDLVYAKIRHPISTEGLSGNSLKFAKYLNEYAADSQAELLLAPLEGKELQSALAATSPARNAISTFVGDNSSFAIANVVGSHFTSMHFHHNFGAEAASTIAAAPHYLAEEALLVDNTEDRLPYGSMQQAARQTKKQDIWVVGFADFAHQDAQNQVPSFSFNTEGVLIGYDYYSSKQAILGIAAGYGHNNYDFSKNSGSGDTSSFAIMPYGIGYYQQFYAEAGLLYTYNHISNHRQIAFTGFNKTARSSHSSNQLMPQIGFGYDYKTSFRQCRSIVIEPFALFSWVVNWNGSYREQGSGAFDMTVKSSSSSLLRSEAGLQVYQQWQPSWGSVVVRETAAYVNKAPFGVGKVQTGLIGNANSFTSESVTHNQSLFTCGLSALLEGSRGYYGLVSYDGEFSSRYLSNDVQLKLGKFF